MAGTIHLPRATRTVRIGTEILNITLAASSSSVNALGSTGTAAGSIGYLGGPYSNFAMRVQLSGSATSGLITLLGMVGTSSEAGGVSLRPLTTWDGSVNSSDDTIWVTGKPCTIVSAAWSTPSSSATSANIWITGTA